MMARWSGTEDGRGTLESNAREEVADEVLRTLQKYRKHRFRADFEHLMRATETLAKTDAAIAAGLQAQELYYIRQSLNRIEQEITGLGQAGHPAIERIAQAIGSIKVL